MLKELLAACRSERYAGSHCLEESTGAEWGQEMETKPKLEMLKRIVKLESGRSVLECGEGRI